MLTEVARFVRGMKDGVRPFWLSLLGTSGTGKTYLAKRIWKWYLQSDLAEAAIVIDHWGREEVFYPGQFCYWPSVSAKLSCGEGYDILDELAREKFVVFDEIGSDRDPSGNIRNCLAQTLCSRVGKWTLITSNKTLAQVGADIDTRIASRMVRDGSRVKVVKLPDYSLWKAQV